jgi:hypothetical protein
VSNTAQGLPLPAMVAPNARVTSSNVPSPRFAQQRRPRRGLRGGGGEQVERAVPVDVVDRDHLAPAVADLARVGAGGGRPGAGG